MEPDVIRLYSSSPPPLEDSGVVEEDDDFRDFTEFETPTTFNHVQALNATSPPEMIGNGRIVGILPTAISNGSVGVAELKKVIEPPLGGLTNISENSRTDCVDCNGGRDGTLTNGFATFGKESPFPSHRHRERDFDAILSDHNQDFVNFAAFPDADLPSHVDSGANWENCIMEQDSQSHCEESISNMAVDNDQDVTGFSSFAEAPEGVSNGDWGLHNNMRQRNQEYDELQNSNPAESPGTEKPPAQNGMALEGSEGAGERVNRVSPISVEDRGSSSEPTEEKGSENDTETETETETSFGRPLSTEALEEFGDFSTTGSVPSPPLHEDTATPADHSQLVEDDEDFADFGDFGEATSFSGVGFADFDQQETVTQVESKDNPETACAEEEFGDFDTHGTWSTAVLEEPGSSFANFPGSDSFADFTSAPAAGCAEGNDGWQAFSEPDSNEDMGESWAAFGQDQGSAFSEMTDNNWREGQSPTVTTPPNDNSNNCSQDSITASLLSCLEKLFLSNFPEPPTSLLEEDVPPLNFFLQPSDRSDRQEKDAAPNNVPLQDVWQLLQDIHNALGLRHQWGGSHCNKALLCSLGIDTRNILFTGQKKQPVIVPMFAASLGMLEPTKEPVKPVSAAEMIASIAQSPPVIMEISPCPSDSAQESLPPVQFDWSSSGLTNPLDGVDPELYELTQAKLEVSSGGNKVADAFARLMSTVEKTNTSTRRVQVQKEENLSEEARRVISTLPDLSFMQAKVLMFPSTLTPLAPSTSSPSSVPD